MQKIGWFKVASKESEKVPPHIPMDIGKKNVGALKSLKISSKDVERTAKMEPAALQEHPKNSTFEPKFVDAVMKRHLEIQNAKPKPNKPTVIRDSKTGKIASRTPKTPTNVKSKDPKPRGQQLTDVTGSTVRPPTNRELKRGITAVAPKRKRTKKKSTEQQSYVVMRTTELKEAGRAEMTPAARPAVEQAILPNRLSSSQNKKNLGGFAAKHSVVSKATHEALGHLDTMAKTAKNSPEHHGAMESFNLLHGHIGQIGNKKLHKDLGLGRTIVQQHHGSDKLAGALKIHRGIVLGRLEEGRIAEQSRMERASGKAQ